VISFSDQVGGESGIAHGVAAGTLPPVIAGRRRGLQCRVCAWCLRDSTGVLI
jgi:hypothetical protein